MAGGRGSESGILLEFGVGGMGVGNRWVITGIVGEGEERNCDKQINYIIVANSPAFYIR